MPLINLVSPILALTITLILVPIVNKMGLKYQWIDQPDQRKHHTIPVVRVGGIAFAIGTVVSALCSFSLGSLGGDSVWGMTTVAVILGGLGFFAVGLADDILQLPPLPRLVAQLMLASFVWSLGVRIEYLPIPFLGATDIGFLSLPVTVLWIAGVANAINWFDGLDGLAAGVGTLSGIVLAIAAFLQGKMDVVFLSLALCGATLGFLRYNFPPAKLYMGDGGSYFIGFNLSALCVVGFMATPAMSSALTPFLILGVPIVDMTLVMASRVARGKSPMYPDRRHLHHRLLHNGCSKMFSTGYIWTLCAWVGSISIVLLNFNLGRICFMGMSATLVLMTLYLRHVVQAKKMQEVAGPST